MPSLKLLFFPRFAISSAQRTGFVSYIAFFILLMIPTCFLQQADAACTMEDFTTRVSGNAECFAVNTYGLPIYNPAPTLLAWLHGSGGPNYMFSYADSYKATNVVSVEITEHNFCDTSGANCSTPFPPPVLDHTTSMVTSANIDSLADALKRLKTHYNASKLVIVGHSIGATFAADISARNPGLVNGILLMACPCENTKSWGGVFPMTLVNSMPLTCAVTAITGTNDTQVGPAMVTNYIPALTTRGLDAKFVSIPGGTHDFSTIATKNISGSPFDIELKRLLSMTPEIPVRLNVNIALQTPGKGGGHVTIPHGMYFPDTTSCTGSCQTDFTSGSLVTLTAAADPGSSFKGWSGACNGLASCQLTMSAARDVTATFAQDPVTGLCGGDNEKALSALTPTYLCDKGTPSVISGNGHPWTWTCQGDIGTPAQCAATIQTFALTVSASSGSGTGDVQANIVSNDETPISIFCPKSFCSANFDYGKTVRLTATPDTISLAPLWTNACSLDPCDVQMTNNRAVTAYFTRDYNFRNFRSNSGDNWLDSAIFAANSAEEIRMLATEISIDDTLLNKSLSLTGGWKALHQLQSDVSTTLIGTLTIKEADTVIKNTIIKGGLAIQSGRARVHGLKVRQ